MDVIIETPVYAYVGHNHALRARVIALLRPEQIEVGEPTDTWVIALVGGTNENSKDNKLHDYTVTDKYKLVEPSNIASISYWQISSHFGENETFQTVVSDPSHSNHYRFWHLNTISANLKAFFNSDWSVLRISGILIPAFTRVTHVRNLEAIRAMGYRPEIDSEISLIPSNELTITDDSLLAF